MVTEQFAYIITIIYDLQVLLQALQQNFQRPESSNVLQENNRHSSNVPNPDTEDSNDSSRSSSPVSGTRRAVRVFTAQEAVTK